MLLKRTIIAFPAVSPLLLMGFDGIITLWILVLFIVDVHNS